VSAHGVSLQKLPSVPHASPSRVEAEHAAFAASAFVVIPPSLLNDVASPFPPSLDLTRFPDDTPPQAARTGSTTSKQRMMNITPDSKFQAK
jgi:hypothetical protein